tara:strand:+ start:830 stop:1627 length:798 start_codon:yes stop_codon:yes gene_type:complete
MNNISFLNASINASILNASILNASILNSSILNSSIINKISNNSSNTHSTNKDEIIVFGYIMFVLSGLIVFSLCTTFCGFHCINNNCDTFGTRLCRIQKVYNGQYCNKCVPLCITNECECCGYKHADYSYSDHICLDIEHFNVNPPPQRSYSSDSTDSDQYHLNDGPIRIQFDTITFYTEDSLNINKSISKNFKTFNYLDAYNNLIIDEKIKEENCSICMEQFQDNETVVQLECNHLFHKNCIDPWKEKNEKCPLCKTDMKLKSFN